MHEAHSVVGQQLHFDGWGSHEGQGHCAKVRRHGRQPDLQPQLALQVQIRHKHWNLQHTPHHNLRFCFVLWESYSLHKCNDGNLSLCWILRICFILQRAMLLQILQSMLLLMLLLLLLLLCCQQKCANQANMQNTKCCSSRSPAQLQTQPHAPIAQGVLSFLPRSTTLVSLLTSTDSSTTRAVWDHCSVATATKEGKLYWRGRQQAVCRGVSTLAVISS